MKTTRELYWDVFLDFCVHSLFCRGRFTTRRRYDTCQMMLFISKEMILRGEY